MLDLVFLFFSEAVLIFLAVELLVRWLPKSLFEASEDNCFRADGSWSSRRAILERDAKGKVRADLWAAFLIVALTGNGLGLLVHNYVVPIPLGLHALFLIQTDIGSWKESIEDNWIDQDYNSWFRGRTFGSHEEIDAARTALWAGWPTVVLIGLGWLLASYGLIRAA